MYHKERWYFVFSKIWYFFYRRKMKDDLFQKIHGNMTFFVYSEKMVFLFPTNMKLPLLQKSKDDLLPKKTWHFIIFFCTEKDDTHPRWDDIVILDGYSERAKMIPCTFMETLLGVFIYCFPMKKNQKTWYIGLKFDFICKLYSWRYSAMKNLQYSV